MTTTLHEAADAAMALASKLFEENGHLDPLWLITTPEAPLAVVHGRFDGPESKDLTLAAIRDKFGDSAIRIIFMCESWMKSIKDGEDNGLMPSEDPASIELIHLTAEDRNGGQLVLTRLITRNEGGVPTLQPTEIQNYKTIGGRFASFFVHAKTH